MGQYIVGSRGQRIGRNWGQREETSRLNTYLWHNGKPLHDLYVTALYVKGFWFFLFVCLLLVLLYMLHVEIRFNFTLLLGFEAFVCLRFCIVLGAREFFFGT